MPRQHRRKTTRWINEDCMQSAVRDICEGIETPSTAARKYGLKRTTIIYRVEKKQKMDLIKRGEGHETQSIPTPLMAEIFSVTQEKELMGYLNRYTYLPYDTSGSFKAARQLVYQFVKEHDIKHPKTWDIEQQAGVDWLKGFILRNPGTNLRQSTKPPANKKVKLEEANKKPANKRKINKLQSSAQPTIELPRIKCQPVALSEQSLESTNSYDNSYMSYMESSNLPQGGQLPINQNSDFSDAVDMNENSELDLEPECHITMVSIKDEPADNVNDELIENNTQDTFGETKAQFIPNLDTVPENDDVFNSFGRNIAFQAKELFQHNQVDALELMHEVQTLVNRRLTNTLRLTRGNCSRKINAKRSRRLFNGDGENHDDD
ncbi:uncharacterized protein LOC129945326 isoform X2 [Eupeodes corollae]|uniref:uncharacterized protein LOC129945326 isoform X2 n=1 Tax=Eupeodes corollae TaxID=290404 RepID=UPI00248FB34F|nr:uncharacterized protein LOC129945326 isoform X2 [Eupeodes corollae]